MNPSSALVPAQKRSASSGVANFFGSLARLIRGSKAAVPSVTQDDDSPRNKPVGGAGTSISAGILEDLDSNDEVRGDKWYGAPGQIGLSQRMMRDSHVRKSLLSRTAPILAATWAFKPASRDPLDVEKADFANYVFFECNSFLSFLQRAQLYHRDGFSLFELTDDVRRIPTQRFSQHPGRGLGIVYTGFNHRPASSLYRWIQSDKNPEQLTGIEQFIQGIDGEEPGFRTIPASRLLRFTQEQEGARFSGFPSLRSSYGPWKLKIVLMVLDALRHQRQGVGFPSMTLPPGEVPDEDIATANTLLSQIQGSEKGRLVLPNGWVFNWNGLDSVSTGIGDAIERCNRDISFNMGSGFELLGLQNSSSSSYALSQTQLGQHQILVDVDARFIASTIQHGSDGWSPVERLISTNYGAGGPLPLLAAINLPTRDWSKLMPVVKELVNSRILTADDPLETFSRNVLFLPEHDPLSARQIAMPGTLALTPGAPISKPGATPVPTQDGNP